MNAHKAAPFIHDKALVETANIGAGTRVWAFAQVMKGATIGEDCNIGGHAFIESGAIIGNRVTVKNAVLVWDKVQVEDDVFLGPNMVFTNDLNPRAAFKKPTAEFLPTLVRRGSTIGANATIVCGVTLGEQCFVGAGTVVIRNVPAHAIVVGNPARRTGWMCTCGEKLATSLECARCRRRFELVSDTAGLRERSPQPAQGARGG